MILDNDDLDALRIYNNLFDSIAEITDKARIFADSLPNDPALAFSCISMIADIYMYTHNINHASGWKQMYEIAQEVNQEHPLGILEGLYHEE